MRAPQVAALLGMSPRRVRLIPAYELPYLQLTERGTRQYDPVDVRRYIDRRTVRT